MKILECSTKGDKRFSALYAKVLIGKRYNSIENWYQLSKSFNGKRFSDFKQVKRYQHQGNKPTSFFLGGMEFDISLISQYYKLLWIKYLDNNEDLVEYATKFDDFHDCFRNKNTINCQDDVIRQYVKEGRKAVLDNCKELLNEIKIKKESEEN